MPRFMRPTMSLSVSSSALLRSGRWAVLMAVAVLAGAPGCNKQTMPPAEAGAASAGAARADATGPGTVRTYYVAAEEVEWDYAPTGMNQMRGTSFDDQASVFVERSSTRIGRVYIKAVYREYTDDTFTVRKPRSDGDVHLGILGPVLRAAVGDTMRVVFRNSSSIPASIHPHGVFYGKEAEGAMYNDGTSGADKRDDLVPPGGTYVYEWTVPESAGPGPADPSSVVWLYHSHVTSPKATNSGLIGTIVITRADMAGPDARPTDVDREFVSLYTIFDENESFYLDKNLARFTTGSIDTEDEDFQESNLMHAINGYVYGNQPGLIMNQGERVRWYLVALGTEVDLHTPHWHGETVLWRGHRTDVIELMPASMATADMQADNPGIWMYHCHVNDHIKAGMQSLYAIGPLDRSRIGEVPEPLRGVEVK